MAQLEREGALLALVPTSKDLPEHWRSAVAATLRLAVEEVGLRAAPVAAPEEAVVAAREVLLDLARKKHKKRE